MVVRGPVPLEPEVEDLVRRACFGLSAPALMEFNVRPDEIVEHLTQAGLAVANRPDRVLQNLDGVAHAVACIRGDARAWIELANRHGWCLERAAMDRHDVEGGLCARRFWVDVRHGTLGAPEDRVRDDGCTRPPQIARCALRRCRLESALIKWLGGRGRERGRREERGRRRSAGGR